jgi:hypothetical protein
MDEVASVELIVTTVALLKAIGLLAIHFPEKFHLEAWQALTAESAQREVGLPAGPIILARQCFEMLPPEVQVALHDETTSQH